MIKTIDPRGREAGARGRARRSVFRRRWPAVVDWLGARKPADLIIGAVAVIALVSILVELL